MKPGKRLPLRRIAEGELARHFRGLGAAVRDELATSLVRRRPAGQTGQGVTSPGGPLGGGGARTGRG
jgi:hypothetical protein